MTREEIIKGLEGYIPWADEYEVDIEVLTGALELLKKEPCDDLISRQAVEDAMYDATRSMDLNYGQIMEYIDKLPSVNPQEPKTGHWSHDGSHWKNRFICSECRYKLFDEPTNYCPNCGAKMVEPQESEGEE